VFVVQAVEFYQNVEISGDEVALHDFGNLLEFLHRLHHIHRILHANTDQSAYVETQHLGVHDQAASQDHPRIVQLADTLVNGRTRNPALACDLEERHACIPDEVLENLPVDSVQSCFRHGKTRFSRL